jgi:hypothetical protein
MSSSAPHFLNRELPNTMNWTGRFRLCAGIAACWVMFWYGSAAIGLPNVVGMAGSLLGEPSPVATLGMTAATLIVGTVIGKFLVGDLLIGDDLQFEGGLMAACLGMFALAFRIGPVRYALFQQNDPNVFLILAAELFMLYALVIVCWLILRWTAAPGAIHRGEGETLGMKLAATATHAVVMMACMVFLCQSDATAQALAAVGISAWLASMAAHIAFPVRSSFWYWLSPVIVGAVGYIIAYKSPEGLAIGFPGGWLGALARPTPLAFAAAGPPGAILGYWIASRWNHPEENEQEQQSTPQ